MSFSAIFKVILSLAILAAVSLFIYLKFQINGDPNSSFNQTTRFVLGKNSLTRTLLGLHNAGDARAEFLGSPGPLVIEWFKPGTEDVDAATLSAFANLAGKYTGRQTQVEYGGGISEGTIDLQGLKNLEIKGGHYQQGATFLYVVFATDYQTRQEGELSTTLGGKTMVISLYGHRTFLGNYVYDLNQLLLSSLLHEFGHEIGLAHSSDTSCIMDEHAGKDGKPLEAYGGMTPQDFCPAEINQLNKLKLQF